MLAEELLQDSPGAALVGTRDIETYEHIATVFANTKLSVSHSKDPQSGALCGVLKIFMPWHLALWRQRVTVQICAVCFSKAINEMMRILRHCGAAPDVVCGVAGLGDLIATATSPYSRNRVVGEELGQGKKQQMESEGISALPCLPSLLGHTP